MKLLLFLSVVLCAWLVSFTFYNKEKEQKEKYKNLEVWETAGFVVKDNPESTASGIDAYYDDDGNRHYDVYLPWDEETDLKLVCDEDVTVTIDNKAYHNGDHISVPSLEYIDGEIDAAGLGRESGQFRFIGAYGIPSVYLLGSGESDTKQFITEEKGNVINGYCMVLNEDGVQDFMGSCTVNVHGNTSWDYDKRSYQFNLNYSQEILGMSAQRKWILDSEFDDVGLIKDTVMYRLSKDIGDDYTPDFRFVNVFFDGQYEGLYLFVQKISIEGGTLNNLRDLESINNKLFNRSIDRNISGGYLVELLGLLGMQEVDESLHLETPNRWMRVKSPNNITQDQHDYLEGLVNEAEEALYLPDGQTTSSDKIWSDYFDKESWIRQYVLQEISANTDTDNCSQFFYVKENERVLYGGPAWDFDRSLQHFLSNERLNYIVRSLHNNAVEDTAKNDLGILWLRELDMHQDFHDDMKKFYFEIAEPCMRSILDEDVPVWRNLIADSVKADGIKWHYGYEEYQDLIDKNISGFSDRLGYLHDYYEHEKDYCLVTFLIPMRLRLIIPVKKGCTIGEDILPLFDWNDAWYCDDELFTLETVVTHDMELTLGDAPEDETG